MRSSKTVLRGALLAALGLALVGAGCIASTGTQEELSASESESGDLVLYMVVENERFSQTEAWWADQAPQVEIDIPSSESPWEAILVKNDIVLERQPLVGTYERAVLFWQSSEDGTVAQAGDTFEVLVVNATDGGTVASYALSIQP